MSLIEHWPTASCCGEPRVTRHVDRCYDHAKVCATCDEPSENGVCPACQLRGAVDLLREFRDDMATMPPDAEDALGMVAKIDAYLSTVGGQFDA